MNLRVRTSLLKPRNFARHGVLATRPRGYSSTDVRTSCRQSNDPERVPEARPGLDRERVHQRRGGQPSEWDFGQAHFPRCSSRRGNGLSCYWFACRASDLRPIAGAPGSTDVRHRGVAARFRQTALGLPASLALDPELSINRSGSEEETNSPDSSLASKCGPRPTDPKPTSSCLPPRLFYPASDASGLMSSKASSSTRRNLQLLSSIKGAISASTLEGHQLFALGACIPRSCQSARFGCVRLMGRSPRTT